MNTREFCENWASVMRRELMSEPERLREDVERTGFLIDRGVATFADMAERAKAERRLVEIEWERTRRENG